MSQNGNNPLMSTGWVRDSIKLKNFNRALHNFGTILVLLLVCGATSQTNSAELDEKNMAESTVAVEKHSPNETNPLRDKRNTKAEEITRGYKVCLYTVVTPSIFYVFRDIYTTSGVSICRKEEYQKVSSTTIKASLQASVQPYRTFKSGVHQYVTDPEYSVSNEYYSIGLHDIWKHLSLRVPWWQIISNPSMMKSDSYPLYLPIKTHGVRSYSWKNSDQIELIITDNNRIFALVSIVDTEPPTTQSQLEELLVLPNKWRYLSAQIKKPLFFTTYSPEHESFTLFDDLGNMWVELTRKSINHSIETTISSSHP